MKVGVLRFQGDVREHLSYFSACGAETSPVVSAEGLDRFDALVIPGGESTTIAKFVFETGFNVALKDYIDRGGAVFATCAGLILLAKEISGNRIKGLGLLSVSVERNAYGRQKESFEAPVKLLFDPEAEFNGVFIRAPKITAVYGNAEVLGELAGEPVLVREGKILAATFHPELTDDLRIGRYFLEHIAGG